MKHELSPEETAQLEAELAEITAVSRLLDAVTPLAAEPGKKLTDLYTTTANTKELLDRWVTALSGTRSFKESISPRRQQEDALIKEELEETRREIRLYEERLAKLKEEPRRYKRQSMGRLSMGRQSRQSFSRRKSGI